MPSNENIENISTNNQNLVIVAWALVIVFLCGLGIGSGGKFLSNSQTIATHADTVHGRFGSVAKTLH